MSATIADVPGLQTVAERRVDGFFYGLFMDPKVLEQQGISAEAPRHAYVDNFALIVADRASLEARPGERAYGMIYALTHKDINTLYTLPGLEDYLPEAVLANTLGGDKVAALCYNLKIVPSGVRNQSYVRQLCGVLDELDFPSEYIAKISKLTEV